MTIARGAAVTAVAGGGSNTVATGAYSQAAGEMILVEATYEGGTTTAPTSVADTAGNTYTPLTLQQDANQGSRLFYCLAPCLGNASNVITVTFGGLPSFSSVTPGRYTTSVGTTVFVAENGAVGTADAHALTPAFTAGQMAFAGIKNFAGTALSGADSGWSILVDNGGSMGTAVIDRIDAPGGTYTAGATYGVAEEWAITAASFSESGGGGGPSVGPVTVTPQRNRRSSGRFI